MPKHKSYNVSINARTNNYTGAHSRHIVTHNSSLADSDLSTEGLSRSSGRVHIPTPAREEQASDGEREADYLQWSHFARDHKENLFDDFIGRCSSWIGDRDSRNNIIRVLPVLVIFGLWEYSHYYLVDSFDEIPR